MRLTYYIFALACSVQLAACGVNKRIAKHAQADIINDSLLNTAHVGICVYDATDNKYLYNYQSDKYRNRWDKSKRITASVNGCSK